jgi:GH35 family endo-1,4-beta-xylanase
MKNLISRRPFLISTAAGIVSALSGCASNSFKQENEIILHPKEINADTNSNFTLADAASAKGFQVGVMLNYDQINNSHICQSILPHFNLVADLSSNMEWKSWLGTQFGDPYQTDELPFLKTFMSTCKKYNKNMRLRNIYSHECMPAYAHLKSGGGVKNKSELEKTLIRRVNQVCENIVPNMGNQEVTVQVIDEFLNDQGGIRKDPFTSALGEEMLDLLFHATREKLPNAKLVYQDYGPEAGSDFSLKNYQQLKLLERLRKRNVPITGMAIGGFVDPRHHPNQGTMIQDSYLKKLEELDYDIHWNELTVIYSVKHEAKEWHPPETEHDQLVSRFYCEVFEKLGKFKRLREISFIAPIDGDNIIGMGSLGLAPTRNARPGLFKNNLEKKPVYNRILNTINKYRVT